MNRYAAPIAPRLIRRVVIYLAFFCLLVWIGLPIYWMLMTSFMTPTELSAIPPHWIPQEPTLKNYQDVLLGQTGGRGAYGSTTEFSRMVPALLNSFVVSSVVVLWNLLIGTAAAYSYSRFRFRLGRTTYVVFLMTRVLPAMTLIIPLFVILRTLNLINTLWSLILTYTIFVLPLTIWVLREYFDTLPRDIEEMALIDGANRWQAFWLVVAPIAVPGFIAVGVMAFMEAWSEFFFALTLTDSLTYPPLLMAFRNLVQVNWNALAAATLVGVLPPVVIALVFQRFLIRGLSQGAVKG
jgi:multiple sugar transport system permease protein